MQISEIRNYIQELRNYLEFQKRNNHRADNFVFFTTSKALRIEAEIRLFEGILRVRGQYLAAPCIMSKMDDERYVNQMEQNAKDKVEY
jgi:hypothetical protein